MKKTPTFQILVLLFALFSLIGCKEPPRYVSGEDITLLLRQDLEANLDINLPEGHFYTSETIITENYSGTVSGAGKGLTFIEAAQGFKALPDSNLNMPGKVLTEIFGLNWITGDVTFQDITFLVKGEAPAESHDNPFAGMKTTIDNIIVVSECLNGPVTVTFRNLQIVGEASSDAGASRGQNLMWPLIAVGQNSEYAINLVAENCEIDHSGNVALEFWHAHGGTGEMNGNVFSNCNIGIWLGPGLVDSELNVKDNTFTTISSAAIRNDYGYTGCFMNNTVDGAPIADDCSQ